ncbi:DUF429 domain-containing protein [Mycobacterium camsae]|uniref:DUF429 domain-containing protein n=1 Tax=Mycobacterium gordonae TaxID=1778 RepID=UPI00197DDFD7|nr:DUF429 domain-containing protein [Mycobacterium gordonae]
MFFLGLDLAWVSRNTTGFAVIDAAGVLRDIGAALSDDDIEEKLSPYLAGDCVVGIDAPLRVANETGSRPAEKALYRDFGAFQAGARPAFRMQALGLFDPPRGEVLAEKLGLDIDPQSTQPRRAIEVYPHPATISLFGLTCTLKYKRGLGDSPRERTSHRKAEMLRLLGLIEGLDEASLPLQVKAHPGWQRVRRDVEHASRPFQLNLVEDSVDAVLCAYVAMMFAHRRAEITIYGDYPANGYIATPTLPSQLVPVRTTSTQVPTGPPDPASFGGISGGASSSGGGPGGHLSDEIDRCRSQLSACRETWSIMEGVLDAGFSSPRISSDAMSFGCVADRLAEAHLELSNLVARLGN